MHARGFSQYIWLVWGPGLELMRLVQATIWGILILILMWCTIVILLFPLTIKVIRRFTGIRVRIPGILLTSLVGKIMITMVPGWWIPITLRWWCSR